jgi:hypothetical protein
MPLTQGAGALALVFLAGIGLVRLGLRNASPSTERPVPFTHHVTGERALLAADTARLGRCPLQVKLHCSHGQRRATLDIVIYKSQDGDIGAWRARRSYKPLTREEFCGFESHRLSCRFVVRQNWSMLPTSVPLKKQGDGGIPVVVI